MTTVRLAHVGPPEALTKGLGVKRETAPAVLVSYFYLDLFVRNRHRYNFRDWVMDSGAFSAHHSEADIDLVKYIETSAHLLASDEKLTEVYSLDVIGDWRASLKNTEQMCAAGIPAIPCFHFGEPWDVLIALARDYPKIALGGCVGLHAKKKIEFAKQCFARVWPKKIHGFGFGGEAAIMAVPFHSVDATNWESGPCRFGQWKQFGKASVRGGSQNLKGEVDWYLALEHRARFKWANVLSELPTNKDQPNDVTLRLAIAGNRIPGKQEGSI